MNEKTLTLPELRRLGLEALRKRLGAAGAVRFLQLFDPGSGNYTEDRHAWLDDLSIDAIAGELKEARALGTAGMVSGTDVTYWAQMNSAEALEVSARAVAFRWRQAVIEDADTGHVYPCVLDVPFSTVREMFIFRDLQARAAWNEKGGIPATANAMLHMLAEHDSVTVVVDDPEALEIAALLKAIRSSLRDKSRLQQQRKAA